MPRVSRCVYCRERPAVARWRPFCSERCKMTDLGRWLGGDYRLPADPDADADGAGSHSPTRDDDVDQPH